MSKKIVTVISGIMAGVLILSLLLGLFSGSVHAESSSEIKNQINQLKQDQAALKQQREELEAQRKENQADIISMTEEKMNYDQQIALLYEQIDSTNDLISAYNLLIAEQQQKLDAAQKQLEDMQAAFRERLRAMEEQGQLSYWSVLFEASSFADFLDRVNMIQEIANSDQYRLQQLDRAAKEVEQAQAALLEEKATLEQTKSDLEAAQQELEEQSALASDLLNDLIAKGEEYEKYVDDCDEKDRLMMEEIANKELAYDKAKYSEWLATSVPKPVGPDKVGNTVNGVTWYLPTVNFRVTSVYGMRIHPVYGYPKMHTGVDLAAPKNTPIYASRAGVVVWAGWGSTGGWWVKVDHGDGFASTYLHMTRYIVKIGDYVQAGQQLGYVGTTGVSTGYHLHFGILKNGEWVDPLKYIKP